jgi:membrane carboxypeptidase/penicillin-binding protein PbpC
MKNLIKKYPTLFNFLIIFLIVNIFIYIDIENRYKELISNTIQDRNGIPISIEENSKGHYVYELENIPKEFKEKLLKKEDRFFYLHLGVNPFSTVRAFYKYIKDGRFGGSSTITQQLAKNILGTESKRNIPNKLFELFYAFNLEIFKTKNIILKMYSNTVYMGNQIQGFNTASYGYFDKPLSKTNDNEQVSLLATLSYPSTRNPWENDNEKYSSQLSKKINDKKEYTPPDKTNSYSFQDDTFFELKTLGVDCNNSCYTTIDDEITDNIRSILNIHIEKERDRGARNGAIVVIDSKNSEVISIVGSKDPTSNIDGDQINMAMQPRPIGSTIKPFIYLKGFESGLRPYTLVEDREYKYPIAAGFPLYPKNYDGQYRGEVTLHESLSNSLNVPTIKVLEYVGLDNFYNFLSQKLKFKPIQNYDSYQYGIALGGLEMDLLTLTHYFTIFSKKGHIEPLKITYSGFFDNIVPQSNIEKEEEIAEEKYIELVHQIISDRLSGVNQFGLESNLNIESNQYAVKTGTSRDFHDSWVVGYTPDFVVGVWLGNVENEPLKQITGQSGAGAIWQDTMNYLLETEYNKDNKFELNNTVSFPIKKSMEWGLPDDNLEKQRNLLKKDYLIISPYTDDKFEFFKNISIPLKAKQNTKWTVNGEFLDEGKEIFFNPDRPGKYEISATNDDGKREIILIEINQQVQ